MAATTAFYGSLHQLQNAIGVIVEVDTRLVNLQKVMDADTNFDKIMDRATESSQKFAKSLIETMDAYTEFARQGYKGEDLAFLGDAGLVASNVGEISAQQAAEYLTSALIQYKMESQDAMSVIDKLNSVSNNYATTVEKLFQGMSRSASVAKSMGINMDELVAVIGTVTAATKQSGRLYLPLISAMV